MFNAIEKYSEKYPTTPDLWRGYGAMAADYIIDSTHGSAKVLNSAGTEPLQKFIDDGFKAELAKCPGCSIVATVPYDSSTLTPNGPWIQAFRAKLAAHPDSNAVYIPFDFMMTTLGAAQAVKQSGSKATIFGGQGIPDSFRALRAGQIQAVTTARDEGWSAYAAMDTINRALQGDPTVPEGIGFQLVTADRNLSPSGTFTPPIDYKAAYLKAWNHGSGTS
jgi:ribose transport system substrate-binding protein